MEAVTGLHSVVSNADGQGIATDIDLYGRRRLAVGAGLFSLPSKAAGRVAALLRKPVEICRTVLGDELHEHFVELGLPPDIPGGLLHVARAHAPQLLARCRRLRECRREMLGRGSVIWCQQ